MALELRDTSTGVGPDSLAKVPVVQSDKGGNPDVVRESQKKRGASVEIVDEVIALFTEHKQGDSSAVPSS